MRINPLKTNPILQPKAPLVTINPAATQRSAQNRQAQINGTDVFTNVPTQSVLALRSSGSGLCPSQKGRVEDPEAARELLAQIVEEGKAADYTGLTNEEIAQSIYDRYTAAFGNDFLDTNWLQLTLQGYDEATKMASKISSAFIKELHTNAPDYHEAFSHVLGYGGLSKEEKRAAMMKKYHQNGGSYVGTLELLFEMRMCGVESLEATFQAESYLFSMQNNAQFNADPTVSEQYASYLEGHIAPEDCKDAFEILLDMVDQSVEQARKEYYQPAGFDDILEGGRLLREIFGLEVNNDNH